MTIVKGGHKKTKAENARASGATPPSSGNVPSTPSMLDVAPELTPKAAELMTVNGWVNAMVNLLERMSSGGSRDEVSAMIGEKHILMGLREQHKDDQLSGYIKEILGELHSVKKQLASNNGASTSFENAPALPAEGSPGAN